MYIIIPRFGLSCAEPEDVCFWSLAAIVVLALHAAQRA